MNVNPIHFHLRGRVVLVVGGDDTLAPALRVLLGAGAFVRIVSKSAGDAVQDAFRSGCGIWERREFAPRDLHQAALAVVATGDDARDLAAARAARAARVPVALPGLPELSDFTLALPVRGAPDVSPRAEIARSPSSYAVSDESSAT